MAMAIKIIGILEEPRSLWVEDGVPWWPARALERDARFRRVDRNPAYLDFVATLTPVEAKALADEHAPRALPNQRAAADHLLTRIQASTWIIVHLYEWESGLGL